MKKVHVSASYIVSHHFLSLEVERSVSGVPYRIWLIANINNRPFMQYSVQCQCSYYRSG